ncbi:hypothetical protein [Burkholderia sp. Bp8963]|uniref:hypothetical protein n=1 Tax=Burkholderia sp. Bp8963 TaxID=2184547 RepID=UPI000F5B4369|nr:hypothetical protein [Burkholderia sp. Bp8963]
MLANKICGKEAGGFLSTRRATWIGGGRHPIGMLHASFATTQGKSFRSSAWWRYAQAIHMLANKNCGQAWTDARVDRADPYAV